MLSFHVSSSSSPTPLSAPQPSACSVLNGENPNAPSSSHFSPRFFPTLLIPRSVNCRIYFHLCFSRKVEVSMKEEDEIQSSPSSEGGSPASSVSNGRLTVTVAAPEPSSQDAANLTVPKLQPKVGGGGREDCWSEDATAVLVDAWGERYLELSRGNLKQKHWKEVADIVNSRDDYTKTPKTDVQCKNRIDTVKKKYKQEKAKIVDDGGPSQWPLFEKMEQLIGPAAKTPGSSGVLTVSEVSPSLKSDKVPVRIPVGTRQVKPYQGLRTLKLKKGLKSRTAQFRKRGRADSESPGSEREISPASRDSFPPEIHERKRVGIQKETKVKETLNSAGAEAVSKGKIGAREKDESNNAVRELTQAILKFADTYEQAESTKLEQLVELEKQRMKFMTELELQRMRFFLKTQLEISELRHGKKL